MPDTRRPHKVILCHAHADRDPVRGLYTRLTKDGVDAWLDKAKLLPGQDWELEIRKAAGAKPGILSRARYARSSVIRGTGNRSAP